MDGKKREIMSTWFFDDPVIDPWITITLGAVAKGVKVIERHFTLDNALKGSDHKCSLNPEKFAEMVKSIRTMELAFGNPTKMFLPCEYPCFDKLGKSVVAGQNLSEGTTLKLEHLKIKVKRVSLNHLK